MSEAPRWRLISAHYLNVRELPDGTRIEWEHKETARETGRTVRKLFPVPMLLDPRDPADHNHPGEIIVTREDEGTHCLARDYVFSGEPTPEMEPLNAEAQAISDSCRHRWDHPIDSLPANGGMNDNEKAFMAKMMEAFAGAAQQANQSVPKAEYDELKERLARLEATLVAGKSVAHSERRV